MRLGRLLLVSIFIIAILTTISLAVKKVTYESSIAPETVGTWTKYHTLPYFDPALGRLISGRSSPKGGSQFIKFKHWRSISFFSYLHCFS